MNRGEIREELYDLGHQYLEEEPGRADRFINQAARELVTGEPWPQRVVQDDAVPGAAVPLLGTVLQIWDTTTGRPLTPANLQELRDDYGVQGMATVGEPIDYWIVQNRVIGTRPVLPAGRTVTVEHYSRGAWDNGTGRLAAAVLDTDELIGDDVFDEAVILAARLRALEDTDENALRDDVNSRLTNALLSLRDSELNDNADEAPEIKQTRAWY